MAVTVQKMKELESLSSKSTYELMNEVASVITHRLTWEFDESHPFLILVGKGNNGGDGLVVARLLKEKGYRVKVFLAEGMVSTLEAQKAAEECPAELFTDELIMDEKTVVVDAIYGFGYKGKLREDMVRLMKTINAARCIRVSIDINSGAEADGNYVDPDCFRSDLTLAIHEMKTIHLLDKQYPIAKQVVVLPLSLPHDEDVIELGDEWFIEHYPHKDICAYKGSDGKAMVIGGSYGMAGALGMNIMGARSAGCSYLHVGVEEKVYPLMASRFLTPVYHIYTGPDELAEHIGKVDALCIGSGLNNYEEKKDLILNTLMASNGINVLDAEALRIVAEDVFMLKLLDKPVIMTPHIGELKGLLGDDEGGLLNKAKAFVKENKVVLVMKGANTIVLAEDKMAVNTSGNQGLATAGSGDILSGMIAAMAAKVKDPFIAACLGVYMHGGVADLMAEEYSMDNMPLEQFEQYAARWLKTK